ncbi:hypothetical protein [Bradyrhizobium brasilense]|uniref:hypothetical protein n=1 Tax=Bradyrhizobium brasilense TaxID=1419277 RepID=UPI001E61CEDA|nr:hypothetical protein [Bradyrhizobium brasilense]MCC8970087.1 hypothetical protein [Bradyrhizobium brasilense]
MSATRPDELARIIAQRLLVQPNGYRLLLLKSRPPKLRRKTYGVLDGTFGGIALCKAPCSSPEIKEASSE